MAFRVTDIGSLIDEDPAQAASKLAAEIATRGSVLTRTAKELDVDYRTMTRWLARLLAAGYDVRTRALELQADAGTLPRRVGRPFKPRSRAA
jgi:hypothetical protein